MSRYSHEKKYFGEFTNRDGKSVEAYVKWKETKNGAGFVIHRASDDKVLVPTTFTNMDSLHLSVDFVVNGKSAELEAVAA